MKRKLQVVSVVAAIGAAYFFLPQKGGAEEGYTYLEHCRSISQLLCDKLAEAKKVPSSEACVKEKDALCEKDPNKTVPVDVGKSGACVGSLLFSKPEEIPTKSKERNCALDALKTAGIAATATQPAAAPAATPPAAQPAAAPAEAKTGFKIGEAVQVLWGEKWWDAKVLEVRGKDQYYIKYDGYADSWNETVGPARIRGR